MCLLFYFFAFFLFQPETHELVWVDAKVLVNVCSHSHNGKYETHSLTQIECIEWPFTLSNTHNLVCVFNVKYTGHIFFWWNEQCVLHTRMHSHNHIHTFAYLYTANQFPHSQTLHSVFHMFLAVSPPSPILTWVDVLSLQLFLFSFLFSLFSFTWLCETCA